MREDDVWGPGVPFRFVPGLELQLAAAFPPYRSDLLSQPRPVCLVPAPYLSVVLPCLCFFCLAPLCFSYFVPAPFRLFALSLLSRVLLTVRAECCQVQEFGDGYLAPEFF